VGCSINDGKGDAWILLRSIGDIKRVVVLNVNGNIDVNIVAGLVITGVVVEAHVFSGFEAELESLPVYVIVFSLFSSGHLVLQPRF
jgi:hypothetical protein